MPAFDDHTDLAIAQVVSPAPGAAGTSLLISEIQAANFPTAPFNALVVATGARPTRANAEIIRLLSYTTDGTNRTYTITRQQGRPATSARTIVVGDDVFVILDSKVIRDIESAAVSSQVKNEVPGGSINGANTTFTTVAAFQTGSLRVFQNGIRLKGGGEDFTEGTQGFTMVTAPATGDILIVDYDTNTSVFATGSTSFIYNETPSGSVNSSNLTFTILSTPVSGTLMVFRDGQLLIGGGEDYTLSGTTITFVTAPTTGSRIRVYYQSAVSAAGNADTLDGIHGNDAPTDGQYHPFYGGWNKAGVTWVYATATSMTASGDLTARYTVGTKLRLKQGGSYKYWHVKSSSHSSGTTTINLVPNSDYTLTNTTITDNYFSYDDSPEAFPFSFNFTATVTGFTVATTTFQYAITGRMCHVFLSNTGLTSNSATFKVSQPVPAKNPGGGVAFFYAATLAVFNNSAWTTNNGVSGVRCDGIDTDIYIGLNASTLAANAFAGFATANSKAVQGIVSYPL